MNVYVIEYEYIGPNQRTSDERQAAMNLHCLVIQDEPGTTNMSHESLEEGWLGTTNDVSATAHGAFDSHEAARAFVEDFAGGLWEHPNPSLNENEDDLETYYASEPRAYWDAEVWIGNASLAELVLDGESIAEAAARLSAEAYAEDDNGVRLLVDADDIERVLLQKKEKD